MLTSAQLRNYCESQLMLTSEEQRKRDLVISRVYTKLAHVGEVRLIGSQARETAISPLHDLDFSLLIEKGFAQDPYLCLQRLGQLCSFIFPGVEIVQLAHAIRITRYQGVQIDVVPMQKDGMIPECFPLQEVPRWVYSLMLEHERKFAVCRAQLGEELPYAIQLLKDWRNRYAPAWKSFHLEVEILRIIQNQNSIDLTEFFDSFFASADPEYDVQGSYLTTKEINDLQAALTMEQKKAPWRKSLNRVL